MTKQMIVNHNFKAICVIMGWTSEHVAKILECPVKAIQKLNIGVIRLNQKQYFTFMYMISENSPKVKDGDQKLNKLLTECTDDF